MRIVFKKGRHNPKLRGKLYSFFCSLSALTLLRFNQSSRYKLNPIDQYDWNKLYGRRNFAWGENRKEEMWVWRYNVAEKTFEVAKYFREGDDISWKEVKQVRDNEIIYLDNDWFTLPLLTGSYFGGNNPAPSPIKYVLK